MNLGMLEDPSGTPPDAELVAASLQGDRGAFGVIVARYQGLLSAVAYNATGNLSQSEDLAQEAFIAAWVGLGELREPARLRAWLCAIVRHRASNWLRSHQRQPTAAAESLDSAALLASADSLPLGETISREEAALMWRILGGLPELYREPLILFYRDGESVARVAEALELSEEAVKQRLARGRRLLEERMLAFVRGGLRRSLPGSAFTLGVVAALPALAVSASAAAAGVTAAKGGVAGAASVGTSAAALGMLGAFLGPLLGVIGGWWGVKMSLENTWSIRERRFVVRMAWAGVTLSLAFTAALLFLILNARSWLSRSPAGLALGLTATILGYGVLLLILVVWGNRRQQRIREAEGAVGAAPQAGVAAPGWEYKTRASLWGLPLVHVRLGRGIGTGTGCVCGWIAVGDLAMSPLLAIGGVAVGGLAVGGMSVGVLALGGFAGGVLALGGWAMGYLAVGGGAMGWRFAMGGLAVAHEFAMGGLAIALHANDEMARRFVSDHVTATTLSGMLRHARWATLLVVLPVVCGLIRWARGCRSGMRR